MVEEKLTLFREKYFPTNSGVLHYMWIYFPIKSYSAVVILQNFRKSLVWSKKQLNHLDLPDHKFRNVPNYTFLPSNFEQPHNLTDWP